MNAAQSVAQDLLSINAVTLRPNDPFTWASGLKSPIYCDNRLTISYPSVRKGIYDGMTDLIKHYYGEVNVIAGTATAGIPHAAWVAQQMDLPMVYVRSKPKDHGQGKQIEGVLQPRQKVVVIDDLLSTGGSVLKAVHAVQAAGAEVMGVVAVFSYELAAATKNFTDEQISFHTVTNYSTLIDVAKQNGDITDTDLASLKQWRADPAKWLAKG